MPLTERQAEMLRLLEKGLTPIEIGRELGIASKTVTYRIRMALLKRGVYYVGKRG